MTLFGWLKRLLRAGGGGGGDGAGMRRLLDLARGDRARAERYVEAELRRDPSLSRPAAIRSAVERLEYERTR